MRQLLAENLPRRFDVGQGEIIDTTARRSRQSDIIVSSEDHPFTNTPSEPGLYLVEGVVAVGEVKSVLTSTGLREAIEACRAFRALRQEHGDNQVAVSNKADLERFYESPPWFLVAYESERAVESIADTLGAAAGGEGRWDNSLPDGVFVLGKGYVINLGNGEGSLKGTTEDGGLAKGFAYLETEAVLVSLLAFLSITMPHRVYRSPILPHYLVPVRKASHGG